MNQRELFLRHIAPTSTDPLALEIVRAEGVYLFDRNGKDYIDLIGGISVANTGHRHPRVIAAIQEQLEDYLHIMVYGEFIEAPQVQYAELLASHLPSSLNMVYFTNSGTEATEGAMKLAKKATNRSQIISFKNSYHGSTQGSLSIIGDEYWRNEFRPLLPGIMHLPYNSFESLEFISEQTACVFVETVQAEAGIIVPAMEWMKALREKCSAKNALLIMDEVQTGFGRTGRLWGFEHFEIIPDILLLGKALGGGMPLGAFIADSELMKLLSRDPILGHITTFGGHPVSCAAGMAAMKVVLEEDLMKDVKEKTELFKSLLTHPRIRSIRSCGLWLALEYDSFETTRKVVAGCVQRGILVDWFLFANNCMRISPPLILEEAQIRFACKGIMEAIEKSSR